MSNRLRGKVAGRLPKLAIADTAPTEEQLVPPNLDSVARILKDDGEEVIVQTEDIDVIRELGRGGYGVVELVKHRPSGLTMAVKRITYSFDETEKRRALMDLNVNMMTRCLYTVRFYGAFFHEGDIWICMEVMDTSLDKFYQAAFEHMNGIPESALGKIAYSITAALNYLKMKLNIMHRDVKPSNVLINRKGLVKLCDFGISGHMVDSVAKSNLGCKPYMAPERIEVRQGIAYDVRSDVWSLGITMVELATGQFPYGWTNNVFEQLKLVVECPPPRLPPGKFSSHFELFINLCLQKNRDQRAKYPALLETAFLVHGKVADISQFAQSVIEQIR